MTTPSETYDAFTTLPKDARVFPLARPGTVLKDGKIATGKEPVPGTHGHLDAQPAEHLPQIGNYGWSLDGQFILVDFDVEHPARAEWESRLPATWMQQTRRGTHRVYRVPRGFPTRKNRKIIVRGADGQQAIVGDLKGRGYLVGPGSVVAGHVYSIIDARDPEPAPTWLLELARETAELPSNDGFEFKVDGTLQERHKIEHGANDDELIKFAGFFRRRGFAQDAIATMLYGVMTSGILEQDESRPYTLADARRLAHSAANYEAGGDTEADVAIRPEAWINGADINLIEAPVSYWLRKFVPKGALVMLYGPGGIGKSSWVSWLISLVTQAEGKVLHVGVEEPFRLFLTRSVLLGADRSRIFSLQGASRLQFPRDAKKIYESIVESGVDFVYLDSIYSHFGMGAAGQGTPINERTRQSLGPLAEIAQMTGCTILGTFHENKAGAYMGSTEMVNVARCVLRASREGRKPLRIIVDKTNDPAGPPGYHLDYDGVEVDWKDPITGDTQMEVDDDGALVPIRLVLPAEPRRVLKKAVTLDEIEMTDEQADTKKEAVKKLHAQGLTPREIGSEVGLSDRHVRRLLKEEK